VQGSAVEAEVKQLEEDFFGGDRSMGFNLCIVMLNLEISQKEMLHFVVGVCRWVA
jgi:hypothetical protein